MARLPELNESTLSAEQRKIYDYIKRVRGAGQARTALGVNVTVSSVANCLS